MKKQLFLILSFLSFQFAFSQGLEDVIVETYYISDANDATDTDGGFLPAGTTTYRIYIDLAPNYKLETVYGSPDHELRIETTTLFFNNEDRGELSGDLIGDNRLDDNTVALDSWVTIGAASESHFGVLKTEDIDGSIVGGLNNDGGSAGISAGLIANDDPDAGIPLTTADGLIDGVVSSTQLIADDVSIFDVFDNVNDGPIFSTNNGAWAVLGGLEGPTSENRVLVAQITTNGDLSFSLNIRVNTVDGSGDPIDYVSGTPVGDEVFFPALNFPLVVVDGCTSPTACNFNPSATNDDGSCLEPVENCSACDGQDLVLIDDDNDGICNADEIAGCTTPIACNYNPSATDDDGSCLVPEAECTECEGELLVLIDDDNDGVCNAEEVLGCTDPEAINFNPDATEDDGSCQFAGVPGCTSPSACNFDPAATADDGSCLEPVLNCSECQGEDLILIDDDNDGVCNADEIAGCQDPAACNFNPAATDEDGSCLVPEANCTACDGPQLVLIDDDNDGVCNADEISGCQDPQACNFDPAATDDDGSCLVPVPACSECNGSELALIDEDGDGVCDADEIAGCQDPQACNFDPSATDDDGSCLIPQTDCTECDGTDLVLIDDDGDGVCNAEEVLGCTDPEALNYNPDATEDDGTCEFLSVTDISTVSHLISVYPNPVEDFLTIEQVSPELNLANASIRIYDISGRVIVAKLIPLQGQGNKALIQFPETESGYYVVEVSSDDQNFVLRVFKN